MIGSFLTRGLAMVFGYAYPAYECYKTVEMNKPEIEQLRFWCQYWILVALLTVFERVGETFVSWVPMYSEAKVAFFIYLWYPKTKGTAYVYDSFFRPYVAKHETEIDRNLLEIRTRAGDMAVLYWQRATSYGQTRIYEILQYVASQSTSRPRPPQHNQPGARTRPPPPAPNSQPTTSTQSQPEEPPSPTSSTSSSQHQKELEESGPPQVPKKTALPAAASSAEATAPSQTTSQSTPTEAATMAAVEIESTPSSNESANPPPKERVMEESIRVTRARLRKTRSAGTR